MIDEGKMLDKAAIWLTNNTKAVFEIVAACGAIAVIHLAYEVTEPKNIVFEWLAFILYMLLILQILYQWLSNYIIPLFKTRNVAYKVFGAAMFVLSITIVPWGLAYLISSLVLAFINVQQL